MEWQLVQVGKIEWRQDGSGYYTLIHHIKDDTVRLDVMDRGDMPVVSFQGQADDVRKHIMQDFMFCSQISIEHAAYIGAELARCALLQSEYIQD